MRIAILVTLLCLAGSADAKEYAAFFGVGTSQEYLPRVEQSCSVGSICMDVVYRWTIRIEKRISGKLSGGSVKAAMIQHTKFLYAHKRQALFVLSHIDDEAKRKLVGADYWIEEYAPAQILYCLGESGGKYGLEDAKAIGQLDGTSCFTRAGER
jgi:hypothetical protein